MKKLLGAVTGLSGFAAVLGMAPPAHATLQLAADVSGITFTCVDNAACDIDPTVGQLQLAPTTINGVLVTGSFSRALNGPPDLLSTNSTSVINNSGAARLITVSVSDNGYSGPTQTFIDSASGTWSLAGSSSITDTWFASNSNTQGANNPNDTPGTQVDSYTNSQGGNTSFSYNNTVPFTTANPFSMTEHFVINLAAGGSLTSRGQTQLAVVPEPASLAVLGLGLMGLGLIRRRISG